MPNSSRVDLDRFDELLLAVDNLFDRGRIMAIAEETVDDMGWISGEYLIDFSPEKTGETHMTTGHNHTEIKKSWVSDGSRRHGDSAEFGWFNMSEHAEAQRAGSSPHQIPYGETGVAFWIGKPLKWPVIKPEMFGTPKFYRFKQINHPGFEPWGGRDYVEVAADHARPEMMKMFMAMGEDITFLPLREFFGS